MSSSAKSSGVGVPAMPTECPLDLSRALRWVDGDRELLVELVDVLIEDYPRRMDALRSAIQSGDSAIARDTAHSLKGATPPWLRMRPGSRPAPGRPVRRRSPR